MPQLSGDHGTAGVDGVGDGPPPAKRCLACEGGNAVGEAR